MFRDLFVSIVTRKYGNSYREIGVNGDAEVNLRFRNFTLRTMCWKNTTYPFNFRPPYSGLIPNLTGHWQHREIHIDRNHQP